MKLRTTWLLFLRAAPEWVVVAALLAIITLLQAALHSSLRWNAVWMMLAFVLSFTAAYLFAFVIAGFCMTAPALMRGKEDVGAMVRRIGCELGNGLCFAIVISEAFYLKLLVPLFRSATFDNVYEAVDRACFSWLNPLIAWRGRDLQFNWINHLYFLFFFGMFLVSFVVHSLRARAEFRRVFLATLLAQGFGGVLYFAAPAMGPFVYHPSANAWIAHFQHFMYGMRMNELATGAKWLQINSGRDLTFGLAAMPSLHAAASFVFLYYAWRQVRWLGAIYTPVFAWILFEAMASRWHYGIDLVAGVALACGCIALSDWWMGAHEAARDAVERGFPEKAPVAVAE